MRRPPARPRAGESGLRAAGPLEPTDLGGPPGGHHARLADSGEGQARPAGARGQPAALQGVPQGRVRSVSVAAFLSSRRNDTNRSVYRPPGGPRKEAVLPRPAGRTIRSDVVHLAAARPAP